MLRSPVTVDDHAQWKQAVRSGAALFFHEPFAAEQRGCGVVLAVCDLLSEMSCRRCCTMQTLSIMKKIIKKTERCKHSM